MSMVTEIRRGDAPGSREPKPPKKDIIVISHRKDADGVTSAALLNRLTQGRVILADYGELLDVLSTVGEEAKEVFICDMGLNKTVFDGFLSIIKRIRSHATVHYIDHHPLDPEFEKKILDLGVDLLNSKEECAAVLVYKKYEASFRDIPQMKILASCGAITDYMDSQPLAKKLIASFDRQFLLYEATVLSFSIAIIGREGTSGNSLLVQIAEELGSGLKLPHQIDNASEYSLEFASRSAALIDKAKKDGKKMKSFAYFKTRESSTGNVANFLIGAFDVPIGVAFREDDPEHYEISLRSTFEDAHDLGKIVGKISTELDSSGGGHAHAAGSRIRKDQFDRFIEMLDRELS